MKTLEITTHIGCRHACFFCPQATLTKKYKQSSHDMYFKWEDYQTIIDKLPTDLRVDFSGYAEPFFHPRCGDMISYAKAKGHVVHVYTTLMNHDFKAQPDYIKVHVPDCKGLIIPDDEWIAEHDRFTLPADYMAMGPLTPKVKSYLDSKGIVVDLPTMLSRGGNVEHVQISHKKASHLECTMNRWHSNVVLPNGDVAGCCMTYDLEVVLGNLLTQTYQEIYDAAEKWRLNDHTNDPCSRCEWSRVI